MESLSINDMIYKCRKSRINFCLDKGLGMISLDMSRLPWWERAFKKKEFVLWREDIDSMREFVKAYDECKYSETRLRFH